jgi:hypothetical protein
VLDLTEDGCKNFTKNDCETIIGLSYDRMVFLSHFLEPALSKLYTLCHCLLSYGRMFADKGLRDPIRHEEIRNILLVSEDANIKSIRAFLYFFLSKINDIKNNVDKITTITTLLPLL